MIFGLLSQNFRLFNFFLTYNNATIPEGYTSKRTQYNLKYFKKYDDHFFETIFFKSAGNITKDLFNQSNIFKFPL